MTALPTGTVTFLFTDIEGSTRLWEEHPESMRVALARHDSILESGIEDAGGVVFSKTGDGMVAAFDSATDAVKAAVRVQRLLSVEPWPEAVGALRARMGVHTGDGVLVDGHYLNQPLNRCARLMAIAHGGQILVSGSTQALVRDGLTSEIHLVDLGEHRLRDLLQPLRVYQVQHPELPADFPPLRSLSAFPGNLPQQMSSFIGRRRELDRLVAAMAEARVVTLTGVGGVGKTRIALQAAAEVTSRFREGAWLVELATIRQPDGVAAAVAGTFGLSAGGGRDLVESLVEFLRTKRLLLVLDNCEHLLEGVAELVEALERSCDGLVVLATSREMLDLEGERVLSVPPMGVPPSDADFDTATQSEAVALFVERARDVDADFVLSTTDAAAVAQVCRRVDGVPLAVELAAAQVSAMKPVELARRIERRFETLTGGRRRVERHQTLRAAIDWSYGLCSEVEQRLLARLSVFAGGATLDCVESVCADELVGRDEVLELLRRLVAKSLVVADRSGPQTRYRVLETIREYGADRLAEFGETQTMRLRHGECYAELARVATVELWGPGQIEAGKRLAAEHENVRTAMAFALDAQHTDLALRLLFHTPSAFQVGYVLRLPVDPVIALPGAPEHRFYPYALAAAGYRAAEAGDVSGTEDWCARAMDAAERLASPPEHRVELTVASARAILANSVGNYADSVSAFENAAEVAAWSGFPGSAGALLGSGADAANLLGDYERATVLATNGLGVSRRSGMPTPIVVNLIALAHALADQDPERAKAYLAESRALRSSLDYETWVELSRSLIASARFGDWAEVLELAPPTIRHLQWAGFWIILSRVLMVVARAVAQSEPGDAAVLQGFAERLAKNGAHPFMTSNGENAEPEAGDATRGLGALRGDDASVLGRRRQETSALLAGALGAVRVADLHNVGAAMPLDEGIGFTLAAVQRASESGS